MTEEGSISNQDLTNYKDWNEIQYVSNLIDRTLRKDHVHGKSRFSNASATAALYAVVERLSSNLINHFGPETIKSVVNRLNVFQTAVISN